MTKFETVLPKITHHYLVLGTVDSTSVVQFPRTPSVPICIPTPWACMNDYYRY